MESINKTDSRLIILEEKNKILEKTNREITEKNKELEKEIQEKRQQYITAKASGYIYKTKVKSLFSNELYQIEIRKNLKGESILFFEDINMHSFFITFSQIK